jgi:hypothetical protein
MMTPEREEKFKSRNPLLAVLPLDILLKEGAFV